MIETDLKTQKLLFYKINSPSACTSLCINWDIKKNPVNNNIGVNFRYNLTGFKKKQAFSGQFKFIFYLSFIVQVDNFSLMTPV